MGQHVDAVRAAVKSFNAGDVGAYIAAFTPDSSRWIPELPDPLSAEEMREGMTWLRRGFPDVSIDEILLFESGSHVCAHWRTTGTHTAEFMTLPATNRSIAFETAEIYEFDESGLIRCSRVFGEPLALLNQVSST